MSHREIPANLMPKPGVITYTFDGRGIEHDHWERTNPAAWDDECPELGGYNSFTRKWTPLKHDDLMCRALDHITAVVESGTVSRNAWATLR